MTLTSERSQLIDGFLARQRLAGCPRVQIAGDASFRRYERVTLADGSTQVLMDAPPEKEDVRPFLSVQSCLWREGYSVPEIIGRDEPQGFLLLEDWGDTSFTRVLAVAPEREKTLYEAAVDVLADLTARGLRAAADAPLPMPVYDMALLEREASLLAEWFLPLVMERSRAEAVGRAFMARMKRLLQTSDLAPRVLVHRDFHADNLFWLADRSPALRRVGMLDFQDAVIGRPSYDLVSLLEDARRDIAPAVVEAALMHYAAQTGEHLDTVLAEFALYGAQRNAKILGIFARLCLRDGKPRYLSLIPRVWRHFMHDLTHPLLSPLKAWAEESFSEEDIAIITGPDLVERVRA